MRLCIAFNLVLHGGAYGYAQEAWDDAMILVEGISNETLIDRVGTAKSEAGY